MNRGINYWVGFSFTHPSSLHTKAVFNALYCKFMLALLCRVFADPVTYVMILYSTELRNCITPGETNITRVVDTGSQDVYVGSF